MNDTPDQTIVRMTQHALLATVGDLATERVVFAALWITDGEEVTMYPDTTLGAVRAQAAIEARVPLHVRAGAVPDDATGQVFPTIVVHEHDALSRTFVNQTLAEVQARVLYGARNRRRAACAARCEDERCITGMTCYGERSDD